MISILRKPRQGTVRPGSCSRDHSGLEDDIVVSYAI